MYHIDSHSLACSCSAPARWVVWRDGDRQRVHTRTLREARHIVAEHARWGLWIIPAIEEVKHG